MKVLVTGGAGFIGSSLSRALVEKGHEVVVIDNFFLGSDKNIADIKSRIKLVKADITDAEAVAGASVGCDIIFSQAGASSSPMFRKELRRSVAVNVDGFINIMNAAVKNGVKRVVYASTSSIYGNMKPPLTEDVKCVPVNMYASTKLMNEHTALLIGAENGIETIGLRYMSVYGPGEESKGIFANLVSQFLWAMKKGESPVIYGDGTQTRDFTYVKDVVKANMLAMESGKRLNDVFNVGTGTEVSLNGLVEILNHVLGKKIKAAYVRNDVKNYISTQRADISKVRKELGYEPEFTLEAGIRDMLSQ
ncbi:MAG: SDR family NAD(P)-dependent oxidoreductase [Candidatus Aenigmarchaeota archaeon]|nr:SDR family NAD(P)-dependent oxidoreductase [Candidatus Aenigmarchaeota archaeon]